MSWHSTSTLPQFTENEFGCPLSKPVLGYLKGGVMMVVSCHLPSAEDGDTNTVRWNQNYSDYRDVTSEVLNWMYLPEPPQSE